MKDKNKESPHKKWLKFNMNQYLDNVTNRNGEIVEWVTLSEALTKDK